MSKSAPEMILHVVRIGIPVRCARNYIDLWFIDIIMELHNYYHLLSIVFREFLCVASAKIGSFAFSDFSMICKWQIHSSATLHNLIVHQCQLVVHFIYFVNLSNLTSFIWFIIILFTVDWYLGLVITKWFDRWQFALWIKPG